MNKKEKAKAIIDILKQRYDDAACALHYAKDYELMIAVRLSAQCTDARVSPMWKTTSAPAAFTSTRRETSSSPVKCC